VTTTSGLISTPPHEPANPFPYSLRMNTNQSGAEDSTDPPKMYPVNVANSPTPSVSMHAFNRMRQVIATPLHDRDDQIMAHSAADLLCTLLLVRVPDVVYINALSSAYIAQIEDMADAGVVTRAYLDEHVEGSTARGGVMPIGYYNAGSDGADPTRIAGWLACAPVLGAAERGWRSVICMDAGLPVETKALMSTFGQWVARRLSGEATTSPSFVLRPMDEVVRSLLTLSVAAHHSRTLDVDMAIDSIGLVSGNSRVADALDDWCMRGVRLQLDPEAMRRFMEHGALPDATDQRYHPPQPALPMAASTHRMIPVMQISSTGALERGMLIGTRDCSARAPGDESCLRPTILPVLNPVGRFFERYAGAEHMEIFCDVNTLNFVHSLQPANLMRRFALQLVGPVCEDSAIIGKLIISCACQVHQMNRGCDIPDTSQRWNGDSIKSLFEARSMMPMRSALAIDALRNMWETTCDLNGSAKSRQQALYLVVKTLNTFYINERDMHSADDDRDQLQQLFAKCKDPTSIRPEDGRDVEKFILHPYREYVVCMMRRWLSRMADFSDMVITSLLIPVSVIGNSASPCPLALAHMEHILLALSTQARADMLGALMHAARKGTTRAMINACGRYETELCLTLRNVLFDPAIHWHVPYECLLVKARGLPCELFRQFSFTFDYKRDTIMALHGDGELRVNWSRDVGHSVVELTIASTPSGCVKLATKDPNTLGMLVFKIVTPQGEPQCVRVFPDLLMKAVVINTAFRHNHTSTASADTRPSENEVHFTLSSDCTDVTIKTSTAVFIDVAYPDKHDMNIVTHLGTLVPRGSSDS
jgi:hypothetical protein